MLGQLRNLVEGVAVQLHAGNGDVQYNYGAIEAALTWVRATGRLNFVTKFHTLLQPSVSHYTFDGDTSERLMLRYYEYMLRLRTLLHDHAPATPPAQPSPASPSTGSPRRPATSACRVSSSTTSAPPRHWSTPPAATSVFDRMPGWLPALNLLAKRVPHGHECVHGRVVPRLCRRVRARSP